jgi:amino acid adenylation domain-containing protein
MTAPREQDDRAERLARAIRAKRARALAPGMALGPRASDEPAYLGEMQRGLWFVSRLDPRSPAYNLCSAFRIRGPLDVAKLQQAFAAVVSRHRLLRSTFKAEGDTALQIVHDHVPLAIERIEAEDGDGLAAAGIEACRPFDLEKRPLVRLRLVEEVSHDGVAGCNRFLILVAHHIIADERSIRSLWSELADAYAGRLAQAVPPVQYDDYVHWARQADRGRRDEDLAYWQRRLDPLPDELRLPFERPASPAGALGRLLEHTPAPSVQTGIRRLAAAVGATPFMVYAFAFRLLLHRYTLGQQVVFATPVSTRSHPATADMIGYFLNPIVINTALDEQTSVAEATRKFCRELRDMLAHTSAPFDVLAAHLSPHRQLDRHPIFQVMFVYQESGPAPVLGEARLDPVTVDLGASKFDLTLFVTESEHSIEVAVEYRADRFDDMWMRGLLGHYETLLAHLPTEMDRRLAEVPMLSAAEEGRLREIESGPRLAEPQAVLLPQHILQQAQSQPQALAVTCGSNRQSYGELERAARAIAIHLVESGVKPDDRVGIFLDRSVSAVTAILGTHLAGAAYVPLDPAYPMARNRDVLADAGVAAVLTTSVLRERLPAGPWRTIDIVAACRDAGRSDTLPAVSPESLAYLLYTSGSTGRPKGVVITHANLRASTAARLQAYETMPAKFLLLPSLAFDSSVAGLFWTLASGGTLVIPTDDEVRDVRRLARIVAEEGVTSLLCVPSLYEQLLGAGSGELQGLESVVVAGESCPSRLVEEHFALLPHVRLFNEYGPTEATVWATVHEITTEDASRPVSIGRPIPGVRVEVLDALGRRTPAGIPGEGWIAGPTVASGYWRRPDVTDERFQVDPREPTTYQRRYRTGDRMAWTADARLLFLGRDDEQIKLRGFRIEPGDIETALLEHPAIEQAAVVARAPGASAPGEADAASLQLIAFVVKRASSSSEGWRQHLATRLPEHMLPSRLVEVPELPRLPNGKIDRRRLRQAALIPEVSVRSKEPAASTGEQALVSLWEGLLGRFGIGVTDNFFELGGHSLLVVQMVSAIERDFEVALPAAEVFQHPTVRDLGRRIEQRGGARTHAYEHLFPIQPSGHKRPFIMAVPDFFTEALATRFRGDRPVYGLRGVSLRPEGNRGRWPTMTDLAGELADEIDRRFPGERCIMAGYSFGAWVAIETVRVMEARGMPVDRLYLVAPMPLDFYRVGPLRVRIDGLLQPLETLSTGEVLRLFLRANDPRSRPPYRRARQWLTERPWRRLLSFTGGLRRRAGLPLTPRILQADVRAERFRLHADYRPRAVHTPTVFFNPSGTPTDAAATWRPHFHGPLTVHVIPDPHDEASVGTVRQVVLEHLGELRD